MKNHFDIHYIKRILAIAFPIMLSNLISQLQMLIDKVSVEAAGIHSIIFGVELIAVVLVSSIGTATLTLSGFETGSKNPKGVWVVALNSAFLSWAISLINLIVFIIFPAQILGLFTKDAAVINAAPLYLLIVGLDLFPKSGNIIFGSGIKGYGEPSWMLKTQLFSRKMHILKTVSSR